MPLKIIMTQDFRQMSDVAGELAEQTLTTVQREKEEAVLGLATGQSPTGLYLRLAEAANRGRLDSGSWRTFNLDEYVGLVAGASSTLHPASYHHFMRENFFRLLQVAPAETSIPPGHWIDPMRLCRELEAHPDDWHEEGEISGKAIVIHESPESEFLEWIRTDILVPFEGDIAACGGIDLQILGIGGRGHVAFHEAGIPFDLRGLLLVGLDAVTRKHAVEDGNFAALEDCPDFALTMSVDLVFRARSVIVLASGLRKRQAIGASILEKASNRVPMSYAQIYSERGGDITFVLDRAAAGDLVREEESLSARGFEFEDRC